MDLDLGIPALLKVTSYRQQIHEIELGSEIKRNGLLKAEKEKSEIQLEIEVLKKEKIELDKAKNENIAALGELKSKISYLDRKNNCNSELENEFKTNARNADAKLWELSQSVYSELINYCDSVQDFFHDYNFTDMLGKLCSSNENFHDSRNHLLSNEIKKKEIEKLKEKQRDLLANLDLLKDRHQCMKDLIAEKTKLKVEPHEGKDFMELKYKLAICKETSKSLSLDIAKFESIQNENLKRKTDVSAPVSSMDEVKKIKSALHLSPMCSKEISALKSDVKLNLCSAKPEQSENTVGFIPKIRKHLKTPIYIQKEMKKMNN